MDMWAHVTGLHFSQSTSVSGPVLRDTRRNQVSILKLLMLEQNIFWFKIIIVIH